MIRRVFAKIDDVFADTAKRKTDAAKARFSRAPNTSGASADVFRDSCREISEAFTGEGYKYAKSGPHLTKNSGPFRYFIFFQSSHNNIPGQHVALWMHANVRSPVLKKWRNGQLKPHRNDAWVAGGMVHNLKRDHAMIEWEIANKETRSAVVQDAIRFIRAEVLTYFQRFSDPGAVISELCHQEIKAFELASSIEFALCFGTHAQAQMILNRFIDHRKDLERQIEIATRTFRNEGFPNYYAAAYAEQVAWVRTAYHLE
jgi:hypothetical protein